MSMHNFGVCGYGMFLNIHTGNLISESLERRKLYVSYCKAAG